LVSNDPGSNNNEEKETPKKAVRGKAREYTQAFEMAWKAYPRKEQKFEAFGVWIVRARDVGGEANLLTLILRTLKWQVPLFLNGDGIKFLPYFERYLKRRKWEDEQPSAQAVPRHIDDRLSQGTDRKLAELRAAAERRATPDELAALRGAK